MEFAEKDKILVMQIPFYRLFLFLFFFNLLNEETLRYAILRDQTVFINNTIKCKLLAQGKKRNGKDESNHGTWRSGLNL